MKASSSPLPPRTDTDDPPDTLTFSLDAASLAKGMTITADVCDFAWTPAEDQGGNHSVTVTVSDGNLTDSETFTIAVGEVNVAPVLDAIGNQSVDEGVELTFTATATDTDDPPDTLTFSLDAASLAKGMTITADGDFAWTPAEDQGGNHSVTVTVSDGNLTDSETFTIAVGEVNVAPVLDAIGNQSVDEGVELTFTATATDTDDPPDTLTFSLDAASLAKGMTITADGDFAWTPAEDQGGNHSVTVTVSDGNLTDSETFTIAVGEVNVAPVLDAIGNQSVDEGVELTFTATATDTDDPPDTLTFSLDAASLAKGMTITADGDFAWTPAEDQGGNHSVTVTVSDGNLTDSETFTIAVGEVNVAPVLDAIGNQSVDEGVELTFTATATDTDDPPDTLTFSLDAASLAKGMTITADGDFAWTPAEDQGGNHSVTVTVSDGNLTDSETFTIAVGEVNVAPTVALINVVSSMAEDTDTSAAIKIADIVITDDGLGINTLSLSGADASSFEISGSALYLKAGTMLDFETRTSFNVTVAVDDAAVGLTPDDTVSHTLAITNSNEPPTVALINVVSSMAEDTDTSAAIKIADIVITDDGLGINTLSLSGADASSFEISGSALYLRAGTMLDFETRTSFNVTVAVDDAAVGLTPDDTVSHTLAITNGNEAPTIALTNVVSSMAEDTDTSAAIKIADIVITDDGLGINTLSLSGADASSFEISGSALYLKAGTMLDFETKTTFNVTVEVDDAAVGLTPDDTVSHTLAITNGNEAPTVALTNVVSSMAEDTDTSAAIKIADIVITDDGLGTNTLSLSGADASSFEISGSALYLKAGTMLDFETRTAFNVTVEVDDDTVGLTPDDTVSHTLAITNGNEAPTVTLTNVVSSMAEDTDTSAAIKIADIVITDDGLGTNTLSLSGADASSFEISGSALYLKAGTMLDFETRTAFNVTVEVDDAAVGLTPDDTGAHTLTITDINESSNRVVVDPPPPDDETIETDKDPVANVPNDTSSEPNSEPDTIQVESPDPYIPETTLPENTGAEDSAETLPLESDPPISTPDSFVNTKAGNQNTNSGSNKEFTWSYSYNYLIHELYNYQPVEQKLGELFDISLHSDLLGFNQDIHEHNSLTQQLDYLSHNIDESYSLTQAQKNFNVKVATGVFTSFAVGYVSYLLRAGSLLSCFLSSTPLWKRLDPIAVLNAKKKKDEKKESANKKEIEDDNYPEKREHE